MNCFDGGHLEVSKIRSHNGAIYVEINQWLFSGEKQALN